MSTDQHQISIGYLIQCGWDRIEKARKEGSSKKSCDFLRLATESFDQALKMFSTCS